MATLLLGVVVLCAPARAQSAAASGTIAGTVSDPQGKPVPGAEVTVRGGDFSSTRTAATDEDGNFTVTALPPGTYTVHVRAPGLEMKAPARVTLNVGGSARLRLQLTLAATSQRATVSGHSPTQEGNTLPAEVNKQEAELSQVIAGLTVTYLPNRDRDFTQFAQLAPAVVPGPSDAGLAIAGQRANASKTEIDGADFDDPLQGGPRGARDGALFFPQTVVREFQIVQAGTGAEVGGTNAGFLNVATKSGSNKLRAEAFYIGRPSALTSSDAFNHSLDNTQNEFGGSFGGPIKRDRAFYYVGFEQDFLHVPYWTEFAPQAPGTVIPLSLASLQHEIVEKSSPTALFGRTDVNLNGANTLNLQFDYNHVHATNLSDGLTRTLAAQSNYDSLDGYSVWGRGSLVTLIGSRMVNQFLGQWAFDRRHFTPNDTGPEIVINGFGVLGGSSLDPHRYISERRQLSDDLSISHGGMLLRFGVSFADDPATEQREANLNARFDFNSLADYLADLPRRFQQTFATGDTTYSGSIRELGLYANARLTLTKKMTITAGLRWDGRWNPQPDHPNPAVAQTTRIPGDLSQWQPRLGLAWNPARDTVVRISTGLYDAPTPATFFHRVFTDNGLETVVADSYFDPQLLSLVAVPTPQYAALPAPPPGLTTPAALVIGMDSGFRNPRSFQVSAGVEQEFGAHVDVSASYLRNGTWDIQQRLDLNLGPSTRGPGGLPVFPLTRPNLAIGRLLVNESTAHSSYDGLLITARFKLPHRSHIVANYTFSHTIDNNSNLGPFSLDSTLNPFDPAADRANSSLDVRHSFNIAAVVNLPWGLKFNPILVARSGLPYTPLVGFDAQNDANDLNDRALLGGTVAARNSIRQPAFLNLDIRFVKDITLPGEGHHLDLFLDVFNFSGATNRNFGPEGISLYGSPAIPVFSAGQPLFAPDTAHFGGARQVQFTVRIVAF
jgi:hypothetical protein